MRTARLFTVSCSARGGGLPRGYLNGGVCLGGMSAQSKAGIHTPPLWTESLTQSFENITFPQLLLQAVTRKHSSRMRTDHAVTRMSSEPVAMRSIVDRM